MAKILLKDAYDTKYPFDDYIKKQKVQPQGCMGCIEIIVKDKFGNIVQQYSEPNIIKIFAKEMLSHRLPSSQVWDPDANSGAGDWVNTGIDLTEEFSARYILLGAAFDSNGQPITDDPRFYITDPATGTKVPIKLTPGATNSGSLINAIPLNDAARPLKKIESVAFDATYQPAGIPILQDDVRALNNIVLLETTIKLDEYNGFGLTDSDFFILTEVALAGGRKVGNVGASCECTPRELFLEGLIAGGPFKASTAGSSTVSLDPSTPAIEVDVIKEGDQIRISSFASSGDTLNQVSPFYLVLQKAVGGLDMVLDRTPVDVSNNPIVGTVGVERDTLRDRKSVV